MDVKLIFAIMFGFVPGRALQRPSTEIVFHFFVMLLSGVTMRSESEQPLINDNMNMREAILINIFSPITLGSATRPHYGRVSCTQ